VLWWAFVGSMAAYVLVSKRVHRGRDLTPTWLFIASTLLFEFWGVVILIGGIEGKGSTTWSVVGIVVGALWITMATLGVFAGRARRREVRTTDATPTTDPAVDGEGTDQGPRFARR
jgi:hypothetical protein